jgi:hypothetical protein
VTTDLSPAWKWRLRATTLRTQAGLTDDPGARQIYLSLADDWDRRAEEKERAACAESVEARR